MTNDVRALKNFMVKEDNTPHRLKTSGDISVGDNIVEIKSEGQMTIMDVDTRSDGNWYICSSNKGITTKGFRRNEIEAFSVYWNKKRG